MDRRFVCQGCGTKWFIHEDRTDLPDLEQCARCGGALEHFDGGPPLPLPRETNDAAQE
jgi:hypothetical protein